MLSYNTPVPVNGQLNGQLNGHLNGQLNGPPSSTNTIANMAPPVRPLGNDPKSIPVSAGPVAPNNTITKIYGHASPRYHHIWLVTGPAGCGKTTVAKYLSAQLNVPYIEGDDFHPKANIEKMSNGIPLEDADRWDWLTLLRDESLRQLSAGAEGVVLTCSALKRKYRDVIRVAPYYSHDVRLHFIYLHAPEDLLLRRVKERQGHYMGEGMVRSQFSILEAPTAEETDVISIDVSGTPDEIQREALSRALEKIDEAAAAAE